MKTTLRYQILRRVSRTMRYVPAGFEYIPVTVESIQTVHGAVGVFKTATVKLISAANGFPAGHVLVVPESDLKYE